MTTAPTPRTYDVAAAVHGGTGPTGTDRQPGQGERGEDRALHDQRLGVADPQQDRSAEDHGHPGHGQQGGQPGAADREVGQRAADEPGDHPCQPRQHQQRPVTVDGGQRGQQVLPAEDRLVRHPGEGAGTGQRVGVAQRAQAERSAEQEEEDEADDDRGDHGPAGGAGQVGHQDRDHRAEQADHEVGRPGERRAERRQRHRRQREGETHVDPRVAVGQQRVRPYAGAGAGCRARPASWSLIGRSSAGDRRGPPWPRGGGRAGHRSR